MKLGDVSSIAEQLADDGSVTLGVADQQLLHGLSDKHKLFKSEPGLFTQDANQPVVESLSDVESLALFGIAQQGRAGQQGDANQGDAEASIKTPNRRLMAGVLVSVAVHAMMTVALVSYTFTPVLDLEDNPVIAVQLISERPSSEEPVVQEPIAEERASEPEPFPVEQVAEIEDIQPLPDPAQEQVQQPPLETPVPLEVLVEANPAQDTPVDTRQLLTEPPALPSLLTMKQSIDQLESGRRQQVRTRQCNLLEEENQIIACEAGDRRNYNAGQSQQVYRSLNPVRETSRSVASRRTIAGQVGALAEQLKNSDDIPEGLAGYVLDELEASRELYSNSGNRQLQDQARTVNTWDAVQRSAGRVLGNPVNRAYYEEKAERKVEIND